MTQEEKEKQELYLNLNLKNIAEQLKTMNDRLEKINWNLGSLVKLMKEKA